MSRFFIEIKYDGTNYHGWQIQQNANSVQAEINKALSTLLQEEIIVDDKISNVIHVYYTPKKDV